MYLTTKPQIMFQLKHLRDWLDELLFFQTEIKSMVRTNFVKRVQKTSLTAIFMGSNISKHSLH
jgi:hypothetical protein